VKKQADHVNRLRAKFLAAAEDADEEADYYQVEFDKADAARAKAEKTLREKERALGVGERRALNKMSHIQYYNARMNARATKRRLRDRLRQRKFELDLVERSFRRLVNGTRILFPSHRRGLTFSQSRSFTPIPRQPSNVVKRAFKILL
jgi:hypothetical protein